MRLNHLHRTSAAPTAARARTVEEKDLPGIYVARIDVEGPYLKAEIKVNADHTYSIRMAQIDSGPSPAFQGTWSFEGGKFSGHHDAPGFGRVLIEANLGRVTLAGLKRKEQAAAVTLGGNELPFKLIKTDRPFFPA